jgi:CubicO group peptidase (beta-lactamase class C family)
MAGESHLAALMSLRGKGFSHGAPVALRLPMQSKLPFHFCALASAAAFAGCAGQVKQIPVHGFVAPGFEIVREEFARNIADRNEPGAACAAYFEGRKVVDLWGGYRDKKKSLPWQEHTLVRSWSSSKGLGAVCLAQLHSQGLLDYDAKISHYWPEFAKNGKENITVRQLLAQQAGLCLLNKADAKRYSVEQLKDHDTLSKVLENIVPIWEPGTKYGYHGASEGPLIAELLRRIDPKHRSIGTYFQQEIAQPLRIRYYIGLPESVPDSLLAATLVANPMVALLHMNYMPWGLRKAVFNPRSIFMRSMMEVKGIDLNSRKYMAFEDPGGNGFGEPRGMAAVYDEMLTGGKKIGVSRLTLDLIEKPAVYPPGGKVDAVLGIVMPTSLGFMKPDSGSAFYTSSPRAYGFFGANGSMGFADPDAGIAFAYGGNYHAYHMSLHEDLVVKALYAAAENVRRGRMDAYSAGEQP